MKIAILSDIHGNLEALEAVARDLDVVRPDRVICLGDLVGYGPDPEAVVSWFAAKGYEAVLGNHEAALKSRKARNWMNFQAKENNITTESLLSQGNLDYCCTLPACFRMEGALFVHGAPPESVTTYLYSMEKSEIDKVFNENSEQLFFVGHTHELKLVYLEGNEVVREKLRSGDRRSLVDGRKYLINCGSVGQPRDGDPRAKYLLWESDSGQLEVRGVAYDLEATKEKILSLGFPKIYADRLGKKTSK